MGNKMPSPAQQQAKVQMAKLKGAVAASMMGNAASAFMKAGAGAGAGASAAEKAACAFMTAGASGGAASAATACSTVALRRCRLDAAAAPR